MNIKNLKIIIIISTLLNLFIKASNFLLNQSLLNFVDVNIIGKQRFEFELFYNSVKELANNSIGLVNLSGNDGSYGELVNLTYLILPLNLISTLFFSSTLIDFNSKDSDYILAFKIYILSIMLETLIEPVKLRCIRELKLKRVNFIETLSISCKNLITFISIVSLFNDKPLLSYSFGQLTYSSIHFLTYCYGFKNCLPTFTHKFNKYNLVKLKSLLFQSVIKLILTQGDKFLISNQINDDIKGYLTLTDNYGSLISRLVFLPIEENSKLYFTKSTKYQSSIVIIMLLKLYSLMTLLSLTFIPTYTSPLLNIILPKYAIISKYLSNYSIYIPIMAFNGIFESYLHSNFDNKVIDRSTKFLIILFICLTFLILLSLKVVSETYQPFVLLYGNIVNLLIRSLYSYKYTKSSLNITLHSFLPTFSTFSVCFISTIITNISYVNYHSTLNHFMVGVSCFLITSITILIVESKSFMKHYNYLVDSQNDKKGS